MVKIALPFAMMFFLAACTTNAGEPCAGFRPIRPAIADMSAMSAGLARQIVAHNETGASLCRWTP
jgi:hypothetical protein